MTAKYLQSPIQKDALKLVAGADRTRDDFFVTSPFLIDCRDDVASFNAAVTEVQRAAILDRFRCGDLRYVSQLHRPGLTYAKARLAERIGHLDAETLATLRAFLDDWRSEVGRTPSQAAKAASNLAVGVDIALPLDNIRLSYDATNFLGIYP